MTESEMRLHDLEVRFGDADKRQESFETFVRAYMKNNSEQMQRMEQQMTQRMDRMEQQLNQRMDQMETTTKNQIDRLTDKMDAIGNEVRGIGRYVNALIITTVVGVATMVWSMVTFLGNIKP